MGNRRLEKGGAARRGTRKGCKGKAMGTRGLVTLKRQDSTGCVFRVHTSKMDPEIHFLTLSIVSHRLHSA